MQINPTNPFNIEIAGDRFYILGKTSLKNDSDLTTLKKIEDVIRNNLNYDTEHPDDFSKLSKTTLYESLRQKANEIRNNYLHSHPTDEKESKNEKKAINDVFTRIVSLRIPIFPVNKDSTVKVLEKMDIKELSKISQVSHQGNELGKDALLAKIQQLGYEGTNYEDSVKYLEELKLELNNIWLFRFEFLPEGGIRNQEQLDDVLEKLKSISNEKLISLCSGAILHGTGNPEEGGFDKLRKFLSLNFDLKTPLETDDQNKNKQAQALCKVASVGDKDLLKLLLKMGIPPDSKNDKGQTALDLAKATGNTECIDILTKALEKPDLNSHI